MSEAPERIWADRGPKGGWLYRDQKMPDTQHEYVRADRIEALEREVKELRAEAKEHKRLKNELVLKAYPAMDAIDEIAEGFRSAVHFVRNNAMNMDRDYPEICHAEEVFSRARAALAGSGSGWRVPDGWKLVPVELTQSMIIAYNEEFEKLSIEKWANALLTWPALLAASPAAPQQGGE